MNLMNKKSKGCASRGNTALHPSDWPRNNRLRKKKNLISCNLTAVEGKGVFFSVWVLDQILSGNYAWQLSGMMSEACGGYQQ